jgi:hypothetical protein
MAAEHRNNFHNNFHNHDISDLVYQIQTLTDQKKQSDLLVSQLESENKRLRDAVRLHRIAVRPSAKGSRSGYGSRQYNDRDLCISRLEAQVMTLTDTLATYQERAASVELKRRVKEDKDTANRLLLQGPVDLTVAWRPKKNVISDRTEMFSKRAAKRRAKKQTELQMIESEQRELLLLKLNKKALQKETRKNKTKDQYYHRRTQRIAQLMVQEAEREEMLEREKEKRRLEKEEKTRVSE